MTPGIANSKPTIGDAPETGGEFKPLAVEVRPGRFLAEDGPVDGTLTRSAWEAISGQATRCPGQPLLLLAPGIELEDATLSLLGRLSLESRAGDAWTALSNAVPELNPFSESEEMGEPEFDPAALVSLLGPGAQYEIHRLPPHFLLLPACTIDLLAQHFPERAVDENSLLDLLDRVGGRLLVHDRIFVHDSSLALNSALSLAAHEGVRPAPWGDLVQRLNTWLENSASRALTTATLEAIEPGATGVCLHITHSWGGGVARWVDSFIEADRSRNHLQLRSEGAVSGDGAGQRLALYAGTQVEKPLASWWLQPVIGSTVAHHAQYRDILAYIADRYGVTDVIVSSLVGHSLDALRLDRPTVEVLHDFYPAWPVLGIHPQPYLDNPDSGDSGSGAPGSRKANDALARAMNDHRLLPDFRGRGPEAWHALGQEWLQALRDQGITLAAPSRSVAELLPRLDAGFADLEPKVIPHGLSDDWPQPDWPLQPRPDGRLRLLVPGRLPRGKGKALLLQALEALRPHARICLLGCGKDGEDFFGIDDVDVVMSFQRDELPGQIARMAPDVAALLSTVPETFGYMLSEMRQLGVPVVATRVGSFAERIDDGVDGWLIDARPDALVEKVAWLARNRDQIAAMHAALRGMPRRTAADMVADYKRLTAKQARPATPPVILM
ncbi:MAG: glycosyltransferase, partial [Xanthomonadales bacterium]|nr:glycosyltransferase [Xanthomonadales bacterium]